FVDSNAAIVGPRDGQTWATAWATIQDGISNASPGEQVWVADGTYNESLTLSTDVEVYGGFEGFGGLEETLLTQRDIAANVVIVDASGLGARVLTVAPTAVNTRFDGFTLTNGAETV